MKQKLICGGEKHCGELLKAGVTPVTFLTNVWSPDGHSWMLCDRDDHFSHALAWEAALLLPQPNNKHRDPGNVSDISVRSAGESEAALLPRFWVYFPY